MSLKNQIKKIITGLPEAWKYRIYRASAGTVGLNHSPFHNMYHHVSNLQKLGFKPDLIIDAGAYIGSWTQNIRTIFPESTFIMIEAQVAKQNILQEVTRKFDNVKLEILLLGDSEKDEVEFYEMETGSSIYQENTHHNRRKVNLKMRTLDSVIEKYRTPENCFIKLDVQGAEIDILRGATKLLEKTEFILLEVSALNFSDKAPQFADVVIFMKDKGFVLFDICDQKRKENEVLFQMDLIFIKESSDLRKSLDFKI